jgi:DNA invertase Pin-like site-specific DNA recombinase
MTAAKDSAPTPIAYSYIRFSHPEQEKGDSYRRQTEAAAAWCEKNGVSLDTSTKLYDRGKSAFTGAHRQNPDRHALAAFLKLVETGRVPHGSYLLIENLDRLSREDEVPACHLLTGILMAGVRVVQLSPYEMLLTEKSNGWELMRAVMELSRGHNESALKAERVGKAWKEKKERGRNGEYQKPTGRMGPKSKVLTHRVPGWVEVRDGAMLVIPENARVVKRIFKLAAGGLGYASIAQRLTDEGVPVFGDRAGGANRRRSVCYGKWTKSYVCRILTDRRALGEYQPMRHRRPDGPLVKKYFPVVVSEAEFLAARGGAARRQNTSGRDKGNVTNLFAGLLRNARDGHTYCVATRWPDWQPGNRGEPQKVLVTTRSTQGLKGERCYGFPLTVFEKAVLECLREIEPHEILNGDQQSDDTTALAKQFAEVEASIALITEEMDEHGESPTLFKRLRAKEEEQRRLAARLAEAQQKAANPLSASWGELQSLADALDAAPDQADARQRLRSALRRVAESVWILVVPRERTRLCAVQIWFAGKGRHRDYLIHHRSGWSNGRKQRGGSWRVKSLDAAGPTAENLRDRGRTLALERALQALDVDALWEAMAPVE